MANITLGGNPVETIGDLPAVGTAAPEFVLSKTDMSTVSLGDYAGKRVILSINPSLATGVCSASLRKFNEAAAGLDNTAVLNISRDLPFAIKDFCGANGIENAEALSELTNRDFGTAYGVAFTNGKFNGLLSRAVVVLDADHKVVYTEQVPEIGTEPNYEAALSAAKG